MPLEIIIRNNLVELFIETLNLYGKEIDFTNYTDYIEEEATESNNEIFLENLLSLSRSHINALNFRAPHFGFTPLLSCLDRA